MGTVSQVFKPESSGYRSAKAAELDRIVSSDDVAFYTMWFDDADVEEMHFSTILARYGSGDLTFDIYWLADTASSGDVVWQVEVAELEGNVDTTSLDLLLYAAPQSVTDSHLGTTARRLHKATITYTAPTGIAADNWVQFKLTRLGTNGSDTMVGDAGVMAVSMAYSDS